MCVPPLPAQTATGLDRKDQELIDQLRGKKVKGVCFDKSNNAWLAQWSEGGNRHLKSFAISTNDGIEKAYDKAVAYRKEKEESGAGSLKQPAERKSGHKGVSWSKSTKRWVAQWRDASGQRQQRPFSLSAYGSDKKALDAAIRYRERRVEQTQREKQDRKVSSRKRPLKAPEGRSVRRKTTQ